MSVHASFAARENIAFTLLADKDIKIIKAFGMANPQYPEGSSWHGVALPGIFVIGPDDVVAHRYMTEDYQDRPSVDAVYAILRKSAVGG